MEEIKSDLKEIKRDVGEIKVDIATNTATLTEHMRRTEASERRLDRVEQLLLGLAVVGVLGGVIKLLVS